MWHKKIKKTIFTLNVDNYNPEITELTYPLIKLYADKIGADFHIISERKFPELPPVYEKLQIYELGRQMENDWNIYIDSDTIVHPDLFDITTHLNKDTVLHNGTDMAGLRWTYDHYFLRDGRNIGSCNWFTVASDWCLDLWAPLDIPFAEALKNIRPIQSELNTVIIQEHLIDDYALSRNIAKYGLKLKTLSALLQDLGNPGNFLWHQYQILAERKVEEMSRILEEWRLLGHFSKEVQKKITDRIIFSKKT